MSSAPVSISMPIFKFQRRTTGRRGVICDGKRSEMLQPIVRVASDYCRIDYELDLSEAIAAFQERSNRYAIVLQTW